MSETDGGATGFVDAVARAWQAKFTEWLGWPAELKARHGEAEEAAREMVRGCGTVHELMSRYWAWPEVMRGDVAPYESGVVMSAVCYAQLLRLRGGTR